MPSKLRNTKINLTLLKKSKGKMKIISPLDFNKDIKNILRPDYTIIYLNCNNYPLIKDINRYLKGKCKIIIYISKIEELSKARKILDKKNIIVLYSNFEINNLKSHAADIVFSENILVNNDNNALLIKEINRVLKQKGHFIFIESILIDKHFYTVRSFYKKHIELKIKIIINNIRKKIKNMKNSKYDVEIFGESNFIYDVNNSFSLEQFYDFLINKINRHEKIIIENMHIVIKGERGN